MSASTAGNNNNNDSNDIFNKTWTLLPVVEDTKSNKYGTYSTSRRGTVTCTTPSMLFHRLHVLMCEVSEWLLDESFVDYSSTPSADAKYVHLVSK